MASLTEKAMLVSVVIPMWNGRKQDKAASAKVSADTGAKSGAARVYKSLVAGDALAKVTSIANEARRAHYARSLPWLDNGARIMSAEAYMTFAAEIREIKYRYESAVSEFIGDYDRHVSNARRDLGTLCNEGDYPSTSEIRRQFAFETRIWPLPVDTDFRVALGDGEGDAIRAQIAEQTRQALANAMADAFQRIAETVGTMAAKLAAYRPAEGKGDKSEGIFRDSLVENVRELVSVLPSLNVTGDARLSGLATRMADLCRYDADALREDATIRKEVADKAAEIAKEVADYF
jgi:hypothetical protein